MAVSDDEEYDDLDELLDEDSSKLASPAPAATTRAAEGSNDEMMKDLQQEFAKLLQNENGTMGETDKSKESFRLLLDMLNGDPKQEETVGEKSGFQNIVSSTLDRIKENGVNVDNDLAKENAAKQPSDTLSTLLDQLVGNGDEPGIDNAIVGILNQMSSKEVLYQPMKDMYLEFTEWFQQQDDTPAEDMARYKKQYALVGQLVKTYEDNEYTNETHRDVVAALLDELEQLGDSPVQADKKKTNSKEIDELNKLFGADTHTQCNQQ